VGIADNIADSVEAMRIVLRAARSDPKHISLPKQSLQVVINASLVGAVLVFADRSLLNPQTLEGVSHLGVNVVMAASSLVFVFVISALLSLIRVDDTADQISDRWSILFVFVWLISLLTYLIDLLFGNRIGKFITYVRAGTILGVDEGLIVELTIFVVFAYVILLVRSYIVERPRFSLLSNCVGLFIVVPVCVAMLYIFMRVGVDWSFSGGEKA
jgi:hypothetical protein